MLSRARLAWTLTLAVGAASLPAAAQTRHTISFDDPRNAFSSGATVSEIRTGAGIVRVEGFGPQNPQDNDAMIFDATCPRRCSGGDDDLRRPEQGNVLIVSEGGLPHDPNDSGFGGRLTFDFSEVGPVRLESLLVLDLEESSPAVARLYRGTRRLAELPLPTPGDRGKATAEIGIDGVERLEIVFRGSGAIDDLTFSAAATATEDSPAGSADTEVRAGEPDDPSARPNATISGAGGSTEAEAEESRSGAIRAETPEETPAAGSTDESAAADGPFDPSQRTASQTDPTAPRPAADVEPAAAGPAGLRQTEIEPTAAEPAVSPPTSTEPSEPEVATAEPPSEDPAPSSATAPDPSILEPEPPELRATPATRDPPTTDSGRRPDGARAPEADAADGGWPPFWIWALLVLIAIAILLVPRLWAARGADYRIEYRPHPERTLIGSPRFESSEHDGSGP